MLARMAYRAAVVVVGLAAFMTGGCVGVQLYAESRAHSIMSELADPDPDKTIENVARWAANNFEPYEGRTIATWRQELAYSGTLPRNAWPTMGAVNFLVGRGFCNQLANALNFMLDGYDAVQHDIVAPDGGHSAISIRRGDDLVFIDPFNGWVFKEDGQLISFARLRELAAQGRNLRDYAVQLRQEPGGWLYGDLANTADALSGEPMRVTVRVPGKVLQLGSLDGDALDVLRDGASNRMTSYLYAFGPRHFADFIMAFARDDGRGFALTFHLVEPIDPADLPASNVEPVVDGPTITYQAAGVLRLDYSGMARWYGVDMVEAF